MKQIFMLVAVTLMPFATSAKPSLEQCLSNVNADLNLAVKATNSTDPDFGVVVQDFLYSGVGNAGAGNFTKFLMTVKLNKDGSLSQVVGTVELDENCQISGSEKSLGLSFDPVFMKLK